MGWLDNVKDKVNPANLLRATTGGAPFLLDRIRRNPWAITGIVGGIAGPKVFGGAEDTAHEGTDRALEQPGDDWRRSLRGEIS